MEINIKNYYKQEKEILSLIEASDYISIDLEMTGVENDKNNIIFDTPEHRYNKYKITSEKFSIIQLGLSFFKLTTNPNIYHKQITYDCYSYNLYLFPSSKDLRELSQEDINLEIKSMLFNRNGKIDFNRWINEGIFFLNDKQYRELYKNITLKNINNDNVIIDINSLNQKDKELADKEIENIKNNFINNLKYLSKSYAINPYHKNLLYYIKTNLPNNLYFKENSKSDSGGHCTLIIKFNSIEEKNELYKDDILSQLKELENKTGVKKIIDSIFNKIYYNDLEITKKDLEKFNLTKKNKKILIGHNMSLDLMFLISKLGETLPNEYLDFKKIIRESFSIIYDTKYLFEEFKICNQNKNNIIIKEIKSKLESMYPYLKSSFSEFVKIKIKPNENLFYSKVFHNAGYDSFVTGSCFLYMKYFTKESNFLEIHKNQIYLMNSLYKSMNIDKDLDEYISEIDNDEENVFVFRGMKKINNINFSKIFGKKLWETSVKKFIIYEKENIAIVITNFNNDNNTKDDKIIFRLVAFGRVNKDIFKAFYLKDFRNLYMK